MLRPRGLRARGVLDKYPHAPDLVKRVDLTGRVLVGGRDARIPDQRPIRGRRGLEK